MNNPFCVEEEDSEPSTSRVSKEKTHGRSKNKKPVKGVKKVTQKKKALQKNKSPFASESSDSDSPPPPVVAKPVPKRKRDIVVSDSEDEPSQPPIRAATLKSCFSQRVADGYTFQSDAGRVGKYYFELRVYNTNEAEKLAANERWKQSLVTLKISTDVDNVVWKALTHLVNTGKAEFKEIQPVLYRKPF